MSFAARHDSASADDVSALLERLEAFRAELQRLFPATPGDVAVIVHSRPIELALAHPWLPLARLAAAPASRRYFAGWFAAREIHVLGPSALEARASAVPGSREALRLAPQHEYAHLVAGANNRGLPPPFTVRSFNRYLRWAWLCEGAATHFSGQAPLLRAAILRRLQEEDPPSFPPAPRDALLLGGSVYGLLEEERGGEACVDLACRLDAEGGPGAIRRAFGRPPARVERDWRDYLAELTGS